MEQKLETIFLMNSGKNNMFTTKHYVPFLKWKPAEKNALQELSDHEKELITPLIQPIMPQPKKTKPNQKEKNNDEILAEIIESFKTKSAKIPEEIYTTWGNRPIFLDLSLAYTTELRINTLSQILSTGHELGTRIIPVIHLNSDDLIKSNAISLANKYNSGLCLRLIRSNLDDVATLSKEIQIFIKKYKLPPNKIDIILDLNVTDSNDETYNLLVNSSQQLPYLLLWRTFTLACGAFPEDLTKCVLGENYIPRLDWSRWLDCFRSSKLTRKPSFGDYTIQHPIYKASTQFFLPSASIRYTLNNDWLVMRGQKGKNAQYLGYAQLLSQSEKFSTVFRGPKFSYGDAYIFEKGKDVKSVNTGNATNWLTVGINHHLAHTIDQISNLP